MRAELGERPTKDAVEPVWHFRAALIQGMTDQTRPCMAMNPLAYAELTFLVLPWQLLVRLRLPNKLLKIPWGLIHLAFKISNCLELGLTESGTVLGSICYTGFDSSYGRNQMLNLATLRAKAGIIVKFGKIGDNTDGLASRIFRFGLSPLQSGMEFMSENCESAQFIFLWLCK